MINDASQMLALMLAGNELHSGSLHKTQGTIQSLPAHERQGFAFVELLLRTSAGRLKSLYVDNPHLEDFKLNMGVSDDEPMYCFLRGPLGLGFSGNSLLYPHCGNHLHPPTTPRTKCQNFVEVRVVMIIIVITVVITVVRLVVILA